MPDPEKCYWKKCDVCGKTPCLLECNYCYASYCSNECQVKDATERKNVGDAFPLPSHSDFCPKLFNEQKPSVVNLFSMDPVPIKLYGVFWHALPGPISGEVPHALEKTGDLHYKELLKIWIKILKKSKEKRSVSYFVMDSDITRVMVFRMTQTQSNEILKLWKEKK